MQRTVQKYEQVLQVLSEDGPESPFFFFFFENKAPLYISTMEKKINPTHHLEAISVCSYS